MSSLALSLIRQVLPSANRTSIFCLRFRRLWVGQGQRRASTCGRAFWVVVDHHLTAATGRYSHVATHRQTSAMPSIVLDPVDNRARRWRSFFKPYRPPATLLVWSLIPFKERDRRCLCHVEQPTCLTHKTTTVPSADKWMQVVLMCARSDCYHQDVWCTIKTVYRSHR
jgi:hypothetical protein